MTRDELIEKATQVMAETPSSWPNHYARALADEGLLADPVQRDDRYAVIHVSPRPGSDAWPIVERVPGGWQSGAHHYPDEDVLAVQPLPIPKHECDAQLVERTHDADSSAARAQAEAAKAWGQVDQMRARLDRVATVLNREWPDDEDHHDFVNQQVEDARAALQSNRPAEPQLVFVVIADYGTNGASVLRVYNTHPSPATLKALPTQPSDDAPDSPRAVPGYRGFIVTPAEVEHDAAAEPGAAS